MFNKLTPPVWYTLLSNFRKIVSGSSTRKAGAFNANTTLFLRSMLSIAGVPKPSSKYIPASFNASAEPQ